MKRYEVIITDKAYEDMETIYSYIAETLLSPETAAGQYDRIANTILTLEEMPKRIRLMDSEPEHSQGIRPLVVDNYTIFYVIRNELVVVARVLYSASDVSTRLSE